MEGVHVWRREWKGYGCTGVEGRVEGVRVCVLRGEWRGGCVSGPGGVCVEV